MLQSFVMGAAAGWIVARAVLSVFAALFALLGLLWRGLVWLARPSAPPPQAEAPPR